MIKIKRVNIKKFRSILDLDIEIDNRNNFITICGENNSGKTNTLRAIDIFFNPSKYNPEVDSPNHKYYGSRGSGSFPHIIVDFLLEDGNVYQISRAFNQRPYQIAEEKIIKLKVKDVNLKAEQLDSKEIENLLDKINFFFVGSINISFPELINNLIDNIYDLEYEKAKFTGLKNKLKESYKDYSSGLLQVLKTLSDDINPIFREFNDSWSVGFDFASDIQKFRDLINDDILFYINDKSNKNIEGKGSGLQRLAYILLHLKIIQKSHKKTSIVLIDEPDIYLHQGLQKKLYFQLRTLLEKNQIFITTHSPTFIDSYTLSNVFLLDLEVSDDVHYIRTQKTFNILKTVKVNLDSIDGSRKIKSYLGIEDHDFNILDTFNIIVEGETDQKYIEELGKFFDAPIPKIISANGVNNIEKYLEFYNSFYKDRVDKPYILVLVDNDNAGRDIFKKINKRFNGNVYSELLGKIEFVSNFLGEIPELNKLEHCRDDHQIEDFIYPCIMCDLVNILLAKKGMTKIKRTNIDRRISLPAFKSSGILNLLHTEKNNGNPETGHQLNFISSGNASESFKKGLSDSFNIRGDKKLANELLIQDAKYPEVKKFILRVLEPRNFINSQSITL